MHYYNSEVLQIESYECSPWHFLKKQKKQRLRTNHLSGNIVVVTYIRTYLMTDHFMSNINNQKIIMAKKRTSTNYLYQVISGRGIVSRTKIRLFKTFVRPVQLCDQCETWNITCLVPRPHKSARPIHFGSRGPSELLRPSQNSAK